MDTGIILNVHEGLAVRIPLRHLNLCKTENADSRTHQRLSLVPSVPCIVIVHMYGVHVLYCTLRQIHFFRCLCALYMKEKNWPRRRDRETRNKGSKRCGTGAFHEANGNMPLSADNRSECHNDNVQSLFL